MGTANVLDAARRADDLRVVVNVTSDKCYENREWVWPYRESDPMGGYDPYSSSKGAAELVISAYRRSYPDGPRIASVRAGNVIAFGVEGYKGKETVIVVAEVRTDDPARALRLFKSNSWAGLILVMAILAGARFVPLF